MEITDQKQSSLYTLQDFYMLRTPVLPIHESIIDSKEKNANWENYYQSNQQLVQSFIQDSLFREAIAVSSPSLLHAMNHLSTQTDMKKIDQTLKSLLRYYIRMSTRPTPFGLCSGISMGSFGEKCAISLTESKHFTKRARPDMKWLWGVIQNLEQDPSIFLNMKVCKNPAVYVKGNRVYLPYHTDYGQSDQSQMNFPSIRYTSLVELIFEMAQEFVEVSSIIQHLLTISNGVEEQTIWNFVRQLIDTEFLLSELRPPMTYIYPLQYVIQKLESIDTNKTFSDLIEIKGMIHQYNETLVGQGEELYLQIEKKMTEIHHSQTPLQTDLYINSYQNELPSNMKSELESLAENLWKISPNSSPIPELEDYRIRFLEKYGEYQEVPILELLDADTGLGPPSSYEYPSSFYPKQFHKNDDSRVRLLTQWMTEAIIDGSMEIHLDDFKIASLYSNDKPLQKAPLSMDLTVTLASSSQESIENNEYTLILGAIPGSDAVGKMFGRFTDLIPSHFKNRLYDAHQQEQRLVDDTMMVEVSFFPPNGNHANVTLIEHSREYELSMGTHAVKKGHFKIPLSDLVVGCTLDHFYLRSKSLGKRVIPTATHMLNHVHSPNVYRFMFDIGMDSRRLTTSFSWGVLRHSPVLPRVTMGRCMISPAEWKLNSQSFGHENNKKTNEEWYFLLQKWRKKWRVPRYVFLSFLDNRLLLDLENALHVDILRQEVQKAKGSQSTILQELGFTFEESWLTNSQGKYIAEFVFPFVRTVKDTEEYFPELKKKAGMSERQSVVRTYMPGSEWLYLKLYGPVSRQDELIGSYIREISQISQKEEWSDFVFFMRYADPQPHIRLRFHGESGELIKKGMPAIYEWVRKLTEEGVLSFYKIDCYEPEIERYGGSELIRNAERIFALDSIIVSEWIELKRLGNFSIDIETLGIISVIDLLRQLGYSLKNIMGLLDKRVDYKKYLKEYRQRKNQLNRLVDDSEEYLHLRTEKGGEQLYQLLKIRSKSLSSFALQLNKLKDDQLLQNDYDSIVDSMIHLHLNRLIGVDQVKEMKIYTLARHTCKNLCYIKGAE